MLKNYLRDIGLTNALRTKDALAIDRDAVKGHIYNLLLTIPGERIFEPTFGAEIVSLLQEPADGTTTMLMKTNVIRALKQWIKYITVNFADVMVIFDYDRGHYLISISYQLNGTDITDNITIQLKR